MGASHCFLVSKFPCIYYLFLYCSSSYTFLKCKNDMKALINFYFVVSCQKRITLITILIFQSKLFLLFFYLIFLRHQHQLQPVVELQPVEWGEPHVEEDPIENRHRNFPQNWSHKNGETNCDENQNVGYTLFPEMKIIFYFKFLTLKIIQILSISISIFLFIKLSPFCNKMVETGRLNFNLIYVNRIGFANSQKKQKYKNYLF